MSSENIVDETQLEENSEVGDAFSQRLVLEESVSLIEENDSISETQNTVEPSIENENSITETVSSKSENIESNENSKTKNIASNIQKKDVIEVLEDNSDSHKLESQDMFGNDSDKIEIIDLEKSSLEMNEEDADSETSRKRKAVEIESCLPTKLKKKDSEVQSLEKTEVVKPEEKMKNNSTSSTESTVSYSMLSGKINLAEYEKTRSSSNKETSSSVEIIENSSEDSSVIDLAKDSSDEGKDAQVTNGEISHDIADKVIQEAETETVETEDLLNSSPIIPKIIIDTVKSNEQFADHYIPRLVDKTDNISPIIVHKDISQNGGTSTPNIEDKIESSKSKTEISTKRHTFYVEVIYTISEDKDTVKKEVSNVICEDITDISNSYKRISDVSAGALGDVSKNTSPSSSISVPPFTLPNRYSTVSNTSRLSTLSRYSTSSTSSVMSSASALAARASLLQNEEHFLIPEIPMNKNKDKSLTDSKILLSSDQISDIKTHWSNSDQLLKILETIDHHSAYSVNISNISNEKNSPLADQNVQIEKQPRTPEKNLESIVEINTPKSEKRSMRKKRIPKSLSDDIETSEVSTPTTNRIRGARKTKRSNTIDQEENLLSTNDVSEIPLSSSNISAGQNVFARWTDRKYYSGVVQEHVKDNKWNVKFDDGSTKVLIEDYILAGCQTLLKGHSVYAIVKKSGEYETGIVTELWLEKGKVRYKVEIDSGVVVKVFADELFLTEDQARTVKEVNRIVTPPGTPKLGFVTLENIVEGKRATRSNRKYANTFSPRPGVSGTRRMTPRKLDSEDEKSIDSRSECALEEIGGVEPELKNLSTPAKANKGPGKIKGTVKTTNRLPKYKLQDDIFGPIPENSNIFNGLSFILVCANTSMINKTSESEKTVSESDTENEMREFSKIPFLEERLVQQILGGGGILYHHFEDIPTGDYDMCKLISNRPNKTAKYIQCIAAGIKILSHEWIVRCCRENKRLPFQELPIGWSLEKKKFVDSFHRKKEKPFQDLLIFLAPNVDKQFLKFWERVCSLGGGTVIVMTSDDLDFQTATLLLADNDCPETVVDRALNWSVPLLSTNWVIQSLVHGEARSFDGHRKYAYDCIDEDD